MSLKNTPLQRFAQAIIFSGFFALIGLNAQAADLEIGKLPFEKCVDVLLQNDQAEENQRYWFSRTPPYVGYLKGEKTTAGGDGTCYLGFPSAKKKALLLKFSSRGLRAPVMPELKPVAVTTPMQPSRLRRMALPKASKPPTIRAARFVKSTLPNYTSKVLLTYALRAFAAIFFVALALS